MSETIDAGMSTSVGKLAEALAKAQGEMGAAKKGKTNPHFRSRYADLASVWEAIREPLAENGLSVVQQTSTSRDGVRVLTTLMHASGEWVRDSCWLPVTQQTPQAYGSALTYARRYSLASVVGVCSEEDDDANAASEKRPSQRSEGRTEKRAEKPASSPPASAASGGTLDAEIRRVRCLRIRKAAIDARLCRTDTFPAFVGSVLGSEKKSDAWSEADMVALESAISEVSAGDGLPHS